MTEAIETKKHDSIVYRYYDYLKANHYGKENGVKRDVLAKIFNVTIAVQKEILREINEASDLPKLISTSGKIYMCRTEHECEVAAYNEFNSGLTRLKKGKKMPGCFYYLCDQCAGGQRCYFVSEHICGGRIGKSGI